MNSIQKWLKDLEAVAAVCTTKLEMTKFRPVKLQVYTEILNHEDVQEKIIQLGALTGWILETSKVHTLNQQHFEGSSFVMNGEWTQNGVSYAIEYLGRNQWELKHYHIQDCEGEIATHLAEQCLHLERGLHRQRNLVYQRLWQAESQTSLPTNHIAIFSGFQEQKK